MQEGWCCDWVSGDGDIRPGREVARRASQPGSESSIGMVSSRRFMARVERTGVDDIFAF